MATNSDCRRTSRFPSISSPRLTKNRVVKTGDVSWSETFKTCDAAALTCSSPSTWPLVPRVSGADHVKVDKASTAALKTEATKAPCCGKGRQKRLQKHAHRALYPRRLPFWGVRDGWWLVVPHNHVFTTLDGNDVRRRKRYGFGCGACIINPDAR